MIVYSREEIEHVALKPEEYSNHRVKDIKRKEK